MPKRLELIIEGVILASRWVLVLFYLGLAVALAVYAATFGVKLWDFISHVFDIGEADAILKMLGLIDAALVASLVVMVIISGYENYVSRFDDENSVHWLGEIDAGSLKIKVASTIVAISSIHLLQIFLNVNTQTTEHLMWYTLIHLAFVVSALFLAYIDRVSAQTKTIGKGPKAVKPAKSSESPADNDRLSSSPAQ
ncbi:TIGR00645 family protein [Devosia sp.]|uniref:TIGR00645 family protein n=1 Tax=Devosia sp. TaxID=1871048 RepID=UPI001AD231C5|nr:TIGR00645 family protein [Devosia sp.]MBN9309352.1 TIGR00645 family protein [Devosia sp.]